MLLESWFSLHYLSDVAQFCLLLDLRVNIDGLDGYTAFIYHDI